MSRLARHASSHRAALIFVALAGLAGLVGLVTGCGGGRQVIGPFVKEVRRSGPSLAVKSCELVLQGGILSLGECTVELVPLVGPAPPAHLSAPPPAPPPRPAAPPPGPPR